jgi:hypothetical protein
MLSGLLIRLRHNMIVPNTQNMMCEKRRIAGGGRTLFPIVTIVSRILIFLCQGLGVIFVALPVGNFGNILNVIDRLFVDISF